MSENIVKVKYNGVFVGQLFSQNRKIFFEYDANFLGLGINLSPFKLPLKAGIIACEDRIFEGLFGLFNDSLPDGWGRLLLDRSLVKSGIKNITALERIKYVGANGMGALEYEPAIKSDQYLALVNDLDILANASMNILDDNDDHYLDELLILNGSSAGARPKILIPIEDSGDWIIKFRSSMDPKDIGSIEYAYHLMAIAAGLDVPEAKLFPSRQCSGYFGVKRFDRNAGKKIHMHSISGLLHLDPKDANLDYEMLIKATMYLTHDKQEAAKQFRAAVFNVFAHNRDDHAKNFAFLMDENGIWKVSPSYDLTFSSGPNGEHSTTIMGEGKSPGVEHLLKLAEVAQLELSHARHIIDQVRDVVAKWEVFAHQAEVSDSSRKEIGIIIRQI